MREKNILLVGVGGQGAILASKVLAEVALKSGLDVKMSEIHGMAQRGGSVVTHVKMSDKVHSPLVEKGEADVILAFEQLEALRWLEYLKPQGEVIVSLQVMEPVPVILGKAEYPQGIVDLLYSKVDRVTAVDALAIATECGNAKASNVVMMGVLAQKLGFPQESWLASLKEIVPEKLLAVNLKAFEKGYVV
ncbi:MAG: indolepyruvate oxidoreductase subunit beta [Clostridia bacterium]|jgi:indolepyruvate ferredoxin oxidoreductase beta subunit|nr:indolepyruvate oxidoreductase subunit beta [Clostridia bacterium]